MSVNYQNYNYGLVHKEPSFTRSTCILMPTKEEAQKALDIMFSLIARYGFASVYDLYLTIGVKASTEDDLIGWENLEGSLIKLAHNRKEYRLILPRLNCDNRD